ncbi:MAG: STAS domain-containing protein [Alphaproteobacteria bacterium]|nr:STAS domain-containing protein [Alphaproteobacteria bacterium]
MQLEANLDLRAASQLHTHLMAARGAELALDGSQVERMGGLCLQVLLAAQAAWSAEGHAFSIHTPSEPLLDALRTLGASSLVNVEATS